MNVQLSFEPIKIALIVAVLVSCLGAKHAAGQSVVACYDRQATDHSYKLLSSATWSSARTASLNLGGDLATINDATENQWLQDNATGAVEFWIGFNDASQEGTWVWASGQTPNYTNWNSGEPNNSQGIEDYGVLMRWQGGVWNDYDGYLYGLAEIACNSSSNTYLQNSTVSSTVNYAAGNIYAGNSVTSPPTGDYVVSSTGNLSLLAGRTSLQPGFSVQSGGLLNIKIGGPGCC